MLVISYVLRWLSTSGLRSDDTGANPIEVTGETLLDEHTDEFGDINRMEGEDVFVCVDVCMADGATEVLTGRNVDSRGRRVGRNNCIKRVIPCRCRTGTLKNPAKCLWRCEPDSRFNFFFSPPAHLCRHIWLKYRCMWRKTPINSKSTTSIFKEAAGNE